MRRALYFVPPILFLCGVTAAFYFYSQQWQWRAGGQILTPKTVQAGLSTSTSPPLVEPAQGEEEGAIATYSNSDQFTQEFLDGVALSSSTNGPSSDRQIAARLFMKEREAQRQAILDLVAKEGLEDSVRALKGEYFSGLFRRLTDSTIPIWHKQAQRAMLHDPRVAKLLKAAKGEDDRDRSAVLKTTLGEVVDYVKSHQMHLQGQDSSNAPAMLNAGLAYPTILAEADRDGESLSTLLDWYELERVEANIITEGLIAVGRLGPESREEESRTQVMGFIASAVFTIVNRMPNAESMGLELPEPETYVNLSLYSNDAYGPVLELDGYGQLPEFTTEDADRIVERVQQYLSQ